MPPPGLYVEQLSLKDPEGRGAIETVVAGGHYLRADVKAWLSSTN